MWTELKSDKLFISFISTILHSLSIRLYRIVDTVVNVQCNKRCLWQCCHYHYFKKINMEIGNNLIFDREKCWEKMQHERINSCYPFGMLHCTCLSQWISFVYKNVQSFWMSIFHFNEFSIFLSIHLNNSKQTLTNGFQPMLWCDCFELFYHLSEESKQWEAKLSIHLNTDIHFTKTTIDFHTIEPVHFFCISFFLSLKSDAFIKWCGLLVNCRLFVCFIQRFSVCFTYVRWIIIFMTQKYYWFDNLCDQNCLYGALDECVFEIIEYYSLFAP